MRVIGQELRRKTGAKEGKEKQNDEELDRQNRRNDPE